MAIRGQVWVAACAAVLLVVSFASAEDWPQWRGPRRDGTWQESGLIDTLPAGQLARRWSVPIGSGYCGPTVADGRVLVMDRQTAPREQERVLCFAQQTGKLLWHFGYPCSYDVISYTAGPRASVTVDGNRAYALGAVGHLHCLESTTGKLIWGRDLAVDFRLRIPTWGIAAAPLVVDDLVVLHVGGRDGACIIALDKKTGTERWHALDERASYSAPILIRQAGQPIVIAWTGDSLSGLLPKTGAVAWRIPFPPIKMPIGVPTPVVDGNRVFVSSFYDGSLMAELDQNQLAARKLWARRGRNERSTDALHCMISTPVLMDGYIYGVDSYGEFRCLDAATGDRVWENQTATPKARWSNIHMVRNGNRFWMFNERGQLLIAKLSPTGLQELSRAQLITPTTAQLKQRGGVCWSHPAFADRCVYARNDQELICVSLAAAAGAAN